MPGRLKSRICRKTETSVHSRKFSKLEKTNCESLIRIIAGQQLSSAAAYTIYLRLKQKFEDSVITPAMILNSSKEQPLTCGLSNTKARYITLIAQEFADQPNLIEELRGMSSEEVLATVSRGLGFGVPASLRCFASIIRMSLPGEMSV